MGKELLLFHDRLSAYRLGCKRIWKQVVWWLSVFDVRRMSL